MTIKNPWKTISTRAIYQNPWLSLREDQVIRPDGNEGIYSVIDTRIATGVVALTKRNEVVLVGQYRYTTDLYSWEIVEGGTEPGEAPLAACQRELKEESGYSAKNWEIMFEEVQLSNCLSSELAYIYLATDLTEGKATPDPTEQLKIKLVPLEWAVHMVESGEITDAISIIGILGAFRRVLS